MDALHDMVSECMEALRRSMGGIARILLFLNPYIFGLLVWKSYEIRGYFAFGGEWLVPAIVSIVAWWLQAKASRLNYGDSIPVPRVRLTEVSPDDVVTVPRHRMQEMLLYLADLEDWLERTGRL